MSLDITFANITQKDVDSLHKKAEELGLKPEQIQAAHYFALPKAYRPNQKEMAEKLGVTPPTIWNWQHSDRVQTLTRYIMKRYFFNDLPDILEAMRVKAMQGSESAAKLVIEYIEDFMESKNSKVTINNNNLYVSQKDVEARLIELRSKTD